MDITLINPLNNTGHYSVIPNLGLGWIATSLMKHNHSVKIIDCVRDRIYPEKILKYIDKNTSIIGFTIFSNSVNTVKRYIEQLKRFNKNILIVAGGPHPTFEPEETMKIPDIDFAFRCEGEIGFPVLTDCILNKEMSPSEMLSIPNLVWREDGKIRINKTEYIKDLDSLGHPAWELIKPHTYPLNPNGIFSKHRKIVPLIISRGCPYFCTFCGAGISMGREVRYRSSENVIEEIKQIHNKYFIKEFHIMDDNLLFDKSYVKKFCEGILRRGLKIHWALPNGIRLDKIDREVIRLMERAGCYSIAVGIESGSQRLLNAMKKHLRLETIEEKVALIKEATKIKITGFFIIGFPGETEEEVKDTIKFALKLKLDKANFFPFIPFPGNTEYYSLKKEGRLRDIDYDRMYIHNIVFEDKIPLNVLKSLQKKAYLKFYLRSGILFNLLKEIKSLSQLWVILKRIKSIIFPG